jgi:ribulose-phosphate 3-epimerase
VSDVKIAPSILAADFGRLAEEARAAERAGAAMLHVDVMDGRFVPDITMGAVVVRALHAATTLPLDIHLMVIEPEGHLEAFARAGAASLGVHVEACPHLYQTIQRIRALGLRSSVALNPGTPPDLVEWVLPIVDTVLVMTVEPGAGGQPFIPEMRRKIEDLAHRRAFRNLGFEIAADGGIDAETAPGTVAAGATVLIAGTAIFKAADGVSGAVERLRRAAIRPRHPA